MGLLPVSQIPEDTGRPVVMFPSLILELLGHPQAEDGKSRREGCGDYMLTGPPYKPYFWVHSFKMFLGGCQKATPR